MLPRSAMTGEIGDGDGDSSIEQVLGIRTGETDEVAIWLPWKRDPMRT